MEYSIKYIKYIEHLRFGINTLIFWTIMGPNSMIFIVLGILGIGGVFGQTFFKKSRSHMRPQAKPIS